MFETFLRYEYWVAATQLALAMLGMGATLGPSDFVAVVRAPRALILGLVAQLVFVPALAVAVSEIAGLSAGIAVGLVVIAAVPGGTMSNVLTYLARGNVVLSIALTAISTFGCLVTTPLLLRLLAGQHLPANFEMPVAQVAFDIAFCLLGPLAIGMLIGPHLGKRREPFMQWCIRGSLVVIGILIVGQAGAGRIDASTLGSVPLVLLIFATLLLLAGLLPGRWLRLGHEDRVALGIETAIRNTNLGLLVKASLFPVVAGVADPLADGVLIVVLLYGGAAILIIAPAIWIFRRGWG